MSSDPADAWRRVHQGAGPHVLNEQVSGREEAFGGARGCEAQGDVRREDVVGVKVRAIPSRPDEQVLRYTHPSLSCKETPSRGGRRHFYPRYSV